MIGIKKFLITVVRVIFLWCWSCPFFSGFSFGAEQDLVAYWSYSSHSLFQSSRLNVSALGGWDPGNPTWLNTYMSNIIKEREDVIKQMLLSLSDRWLYSKSEWIFSDVRYISEEKSQGVLFSSLGIQSTRTWLWLWQPHRAEKGL